MFFKKVYKRCSERNESLEYNVINENIEINKGLIDSLIRSGMANVKSIDDGYELYYNV